MNAARQRLEAHREAKKQKEQAESVNEEKKQVEKIPISNKNDSPNFLVKLFNFDFLRWLPNHHYNVLYEKYPRITLGATISIYTALQVFAYRSGFGAVFFILSIFLALFLSLGQKKEGEISAYSVFNPGCERLPGQMTAEHFERDVLRRRL